MRLALFLPAALLLPCALAAQDSSAAYTAPYQQRALEIYRTAIGMRTVAKGGQVPRLARYLADQFLAAGFPAADVRVLPFVAPGGDTTASLVVRYRGSGSSGKKPILLLGHMDVVDALPRDWGRDPFVLTEKDGYLIGRGAADNKFGVATLSATFLRLKREGFVPTRDLILAFTGDEETGMVTTRALATTQRALTDAEFALNGDGGGGVLGESGKPLWYLVQTAEKTYASFELTATNPGGHSSRPSPDNAIYDLAGVVKALQAYRFPVQINEATRLYFRTVAPVIGGEVGAAMTRLARDPTDTAAANVLWTRPDYVGVTRTTCVPTMLRGGHAENALPQSATVTVNCRILPGIEVAAVQATLSNLARSAAPGVRVEGIGEPRTSPASPVREDVARAVATAVAKIRPGTPIVPYMAPFATDGREFRRAGIPTYGVGALFARENDVFSHGLNERVPVRSFYDALEYWRTLLRALAGPSSSARTP